MSEHWFISGANRGIGLELTRQLMARGDGVTAGVRSEEARDALRRAACSATCESRYGGVRHAGHGAIQAAAKSMSPIDALVANAGAFGPSPQSMLEMDFDAALDLFNVNTLGPLRLALAFFTELRGAQNPRIALMSSELGSMANVNPSTAIYSATKAALDKFAQCLAIELKPQGMTSRRDASGMGAHGHGRPQRALSASQKASRESSRPSTGSASKTAEAS